MPPALAIAGGGGNAPAVAGGLGTVGGAPAIAGGGCGGGLGTVGGADPAIAAAAEKLRLKEEKENKRKEKMAADKKEREEQKALFEASEPGKAKTHLAELQPLLDSAAVYQAAAKQSKTLTRP